MKSDILKKYIEEGGSNCEECGITIFIDKGSLKEKTSYNDVISMVVPKLVEKLNNNYDYYYGTKKKAKDKLKLIDSNACLYSATNDGVSHYLEPFEEGFINNPSEIKNYLKYLYKIEVGDYKGISHSEKRYEDFPYIDDLCEFEMGLIVVYEGGEIEITDNYLSAEALLDYIDYGYLCLNIIEFII